MKKQDLIKALDDFPDDFELCLSGYVKIPRETLDGLEDGEPIDDDDQELMLVVDWPILGLASNHESKEIRFIVEGTNMEALNEIDGEMRPFEDQTI